MITGKLTFKEPEAEELGSLTGPGFEPRCPAGGGNAVLVAGRMCSRRVAVSPLWALATLPVKRGPHGICPGRGRKGRNGRTADMGFCAGPQKPVPGRPPFRTRTSAFFVFFLLPLPLFLFFNFIFGGSFNKTLILGTERHTADESKDVPWAP